MYCIALYCAVLRYQSDEFLLRAQAGIPANEILAAATVNCAELFMKQVGPTAPALKLICAHMPYAVLLRGSVVDDIRKSTVPRLLVVRQAVLP
jgi:hypothetical protein